MKHMGVFSMPYIKTKTSVPISKEKETVLKAKLGSAITALGKGEAWLMLEFEDNCRLWFRGEQDTPLAMVEVSLFGKASEDQYEKMTKAVCALLSEELGIDPEGIYVKYEEVAHWGYNNFNF